jgi:hypothetical protein
MKKFWGVLVLIALIGITLWATYEYNRESIGQFTHLPDEDVIPENEWKVVQQADSISMIKVEWDQKYGATKIAYCRAVFQNSTQFKLVAPWITLTIEKANLDNIRFVKEFFDSAKIRTH